MGADSVVDVKCAECGKTIKVERNKIENILQFKGKYYHSGCFREMVAKKLTSKRCKQDMWREALDELPQLELKAKTMLEWRFHRDDLNDWLLDHYDISVVPDKFWQMVADLERGIYKSKRCKPIKIEQLLNMWKWGQVRLDKIAVDNKFRNSGPSNGDDRIRYDFAILLKHTNDYKRYQDKMKYEREEQEKIIQSVKTQPVIDYASLGKNNNCKTEIDSDDMNSLLDAIF